MQKWEYMTVTLTANIENAGAREYVAERWPAWDAPRYAPQAVNPALNALGEDGWELVHMEPVAGSGNNGDILFTGDYRQYSNVYFCVFKRMAGESESERAR